MLTDERQPGIKIDGLDSAARTRHEGVRQHRNQLGPISGPGIGLDRRIERARVPASRLAPAFVHGPGIQGTEESLVAELVSQFTGVFGHGVGVVKRGRRRIRMKLTDTIEVAAGKALFQGFRADHVIGHQQELLAGRPVVFGHDIGQFRQGPGARVIAEKKIEHGHEVALARSEAAMQVRTRAPASGKRVFHRSRVCALGS
jgi:hypothetical protein